MSGSVRARRIRRPIIQVEDVERVYWTTADLAELRNRKIGFVSQRFNFVPRTSAVATVELPLAYAELGRAERRRRAVAALTAVGMTDRMDHLVISDQPTLREDAA